MGLNQGVELRAQQTPLTLTSNLANMQKDLAERLPLIVEDRALDKELVALIEGIRAQGWSLYV